MLSYSSIFSDLFLLFLISKASSGRFLCSEEWRLKTFCENRTCVGTVRRCVCTIQSQFSFFQTCYLEYKIDRQSFAKRLMTPKRFIRWPSKILLLHIFTASLGKYQTCCQATNSKNNFWQVESIYQDIVFCFLWVGGRGGGGRTKSFFRYWIGRVLWHSIPNDDFLKKYTWSRCKYKLIIYRQRSQYFTNNMQRHQCDLSQQVTFGHGGTK